MRILPGKPSIGNPVSLDLDGRGSSGRWRDRIPGRLSRDSRPRRGKDHPSRLSRWRGRDRRGRAPTRAFAVGSHPGSAELSRESLPGMPHPPETRSYGSAGSTWRRHGPGQEPRLRTQRVFICAVVDTRDEPPQGVHLLGLRNAMQGRGCLLEEKDRPRTLIGDASLAKAPSVLRTARTTCSPSSASRSTKRASVSACSRVFGGR